MLFFFFFWGEKKIAGINFSGSRHFEYFPKPVFFSQNPRNRQKLILLSYIGLLIFQ